MSFSTDFQSLVKRSVHQSTELYSDEKNKDIANPYYIGKGNPNADILLIGKELAIDPVKNPIAFRNESINNPNQWGKIIKGELEVDEFDPRWPYNKDLPKSAGATWNQYQRLNNLLFEENKSESESTFFQKFFLTEINTTPSKYSPGRKNILGELHQDRMEMFRQEKFFQNFLIVIVAAGGYWHIEDIQSIFGNELVPDNQTWHQNKFIVFTHPEQKKLIISMRQLSTSVSGELMGRIVEEVEKFRLIQREEKSF
ncbi:hypothetical protein KIH41_16950 [Litoribacter ruber]|uniref:hypothetical protein n=1 Tax=Litoribacter ruber TaxID=702568 RepID=UPI001BDA14BA|nr:hypothetical protein [Litoribacter ruber]MBT0812978.1 hypothetical protein [Litoribacter ruber]